MNGEQGFTTIVWQSAVALLLFKGYGYAEIPFG